MDPFCILFIGNHNFPKNKKERNLKSKSKSPGEEMKRLEKDDAEPDLRNYFTNGTKRKI